MLLDRFTFGQVVFVFDSFVLVGVFITDDVGADVEDGSIVKSDEAVDEVAI